MAINCFKPIFTSHHKHISSRFFPYFSSNSSLLFKNIQITDTVRPISNLNPSPDVPLLIDKLNNVITILYILKFHKVIKP